MIKLNPYLYFNGNCEEAFNLYKIVFRTDFKHIGRYKDVPLTDQYLFQQDGDKIMHVSLPIGGETILMGSDNTELYQQSVSTNNFALYVNTDNKEEADRLFNELSDEGLVMVPMMETFWGSYYGLLTDKFGVRWKITFDLAPAYNE